MPLDPKQLPDDPAILQKIIVDLTAQMERDQSRFGKMERLLEQLLEAKSGRRSEKLSADQLALFVSELRAQGVDAKAEEGDKQGKGDDDNNSRSAGDGATEDKPRGKAVRRPLPTHLKRERIIHDVAEALKHCTHCDQDLRPVGEESSERYEFIPAQLTVIEDVCKKYACACTIHTATKPAQPIEKSSAGASLLAQVIVAKHADHLPVHRQVKMFRRSGVEFSDETIGFRSAGWSLLRKHLRLDAAECGFIVALVRDAETLRAGVESRGNRRHSCKGARQAAAASA